MKPKIFWQMFSIVVASGILIQAGFAQAPNGVLFSPMFSGAGRGLFDLTDASTEISEDFGTGDSLVTISETVSVVQSMAGVITASGTGTTVTVEGDNTNFTFPAKYTLKGSIKTVGSQIAMALAFTGRGTAFFDNANRAVSESVTYLVKIDPSAGTMTGRKTGTASAAGKGSVKITDPLIDGAIPSQFAPVGWHFFMMVATAGAKVTGTAQVILENGRSFPFTVKGIYSANTDTAKLTLTGTGISKGGKLTVTVVGNNVTEVTGSLLGQKVAIN